MPVSHRAYWIAVLTLGFALVLASAVAAVFVVPDLKVILHRVAVGLVSIAGCVAGFLLIAKSASRLELSGKAAEDLHIPGFDAKI